MEYGNIQYLANESESLMPRSPLTNDSYDTLLIDEIRDHIFIVTLNRPEASNAFNTLMVRDIYQLFERVALDQTDYRCIVVTGAGERSFCAGADLKERRGMDDSVWSRQHLEIERMVRAIKDCPIPIIGAVNGAAYGGGCELACLMDFLYASETARFALPETGLGIIPGAGGTQTLPRTVGERRAKEIILTGRSFSAQEAFEWGLVNKVVPIDQLLNSAIETAKKISTNAPIAIRQAKQAIQKGMQMSLADALAFEIEAYNRTVPTRDRREGIQSFNEKRRPKFEGK